MELQGRISQCIMCSSHGTSEWYVCDGEGTTEKKEKGGTSQTVILNEKVNLVRLKMKKKIEICAFYLPRKSF